MKNDDIKGFLEKSTDITGSAVGATVGLVGGPIGAIVGAVVGTALTIGLKEVINWKLSNRQETRVAASAV